MLPVGTVTFLFTDIEDSTRLWDAHPQVMGTALAWHDGQWQRLIADHGGQVVKTTGDGVHAVFGSAVDAVNALVAGQRQMAAKSWPQIGPLRVRAALHAGAADLRDGDYYGSTVNRAARLMSVAAGGQMLLSAAVAELVVEQLPDRVTLIDLGQQRLRGFQRPERVFQLGHPDLPAGFPPLPSALAAPHNLPPQLSSFVGRQAQLQELVARLAGGAAGGEEWGATRLVTISGPGGAGKTRIALEVGRRLLDRFPDGVWLVELAAVAEPELLVSTLAAVLQLQERADIGPLDLVVAYLASKRALLLLDNGEHLIAETARVSEHLLRACPQLRLVVTTREPLRIPGESVYLLPALSVPPSDGASVSALQAAEAVQLFVERAQSVKGAFRLTAQNAAAVAHICRELDGLPLAIELAAARVRSFTPQQIARRLEDRFSLLKAGRRTATARQQTLAGLIDWSYQLLSPPEQTLFRRLAAFADGWTVTAAEAICPDVDVLDLLPELVDKSLVTPAETTDEHEDEPRYHYLNSIRQYAYLKLSESDELPATQRRLMDYYVRVAAEWDGRLDLGNPVPWLDRFEREHGNMRQVLQWGLALAPEQALRLAGNLSGFWGRRAYNSEGARWLQATIEAVREPSAAAAAARAKAHLGLASVANAKGDTELALRSAHQSVALYRDLDDPEGLGRALARLAYLALLRNEVDRAQEALTESKALGEQTGDFVIRSMAAGLQAELRLRFGEDLGDVRAMVEANQQLIEAWGDPYGTAMNALGLARMHMAQQQWSQAVARSRLAETHFADLGDR
ncbi:MAG: adenylate/guanylate cyclase domain-containing protein, partial [Candidatus Promineifilaceae bacterium]|nr:adenylate/guanylate cyclase domain-containing protein [Candidatus Promineifilaceae bacterium]